MPGMVAAYAFDGMNLLLDACRNTGVPDREKIQDYLLNHAFEGVSGSFRFGELGSRMDERIGVFPVMNGFPAATGDD